MEDYTFLDDFSKYSEVRLLASKDRVSEVVKEVLKSWERQTGEKLRRVRTDGGTEYVNANLRQVFEELGVKHGKSAPYTPQQNGAAERLNRTLLERVRAMMEGSPDCPQSMWGEAVLTSSHLRNVSATSDSVLPGFVTGGRANVCRLRKSLYGLRQASRTWHKKLHEQLVAMGFKESDADPSLYVRDVDGDVVHVLVYVDDLLIASYGVAKVLEVKSAIMQVFDCRDMGEADLFLGLAIQRDRESRTITVSQRRMIEEVVAEYGMSKSRPKAVPMSPGTVLVKPGADERLEVERYPYSALVGSLLYIAGCTRPDISHAVGVLTRHMSAPGKEHWKAAKEVVRYLAGTADYGLVFGDGRVDEGLIGYTDADHAGCVESRRSTTGFVFSLHGGPVSWSSKFQRTVAVSTMEAEYVAASEGVKEALWLRQLLCDMGYMLAPTKVNCDSQCAIKVIKNPVISERSKHIAVRYHLIREHVTRGAIVMVDCRTSEMVADCLTKPLAFEKFRQFRESMNVCKI